MKQLGAISGKKIKDQACTDLKETRKKTNNTKLKISWNSVLNHTITCKKNATTYY